MVQPVYCHGVVGRFVGAGAVAILTKWSYLFSFMWLLFPTTFFFIVRIAAGIWGQNPAS